MVVVGDSRKVSSSAYERIRQPSEALVLIERHSPGNTKYRSRKLRFENSELSIADGVSNPTLR